MKNVPILTLIFFVLFFPASAQYNKNENKKWVFGNGAAINFSSGAPIPFSSAITADEGCASVSDVAGNLLFYTNGKKVWNHLHNVMPNGSSITHYLTASRTQGAVIVPKPGEIGKYYIFSLGEPTPSGPNNHLTWVVVNMALDGGLGDIDTSYGYANELPGCFPLTEKLFTYPKHGCDVWLVARSQSGTQFFSFAITPYGIAAPVVSTCGFPLYPAPPETYIGGVAKISHNGKWVVAQSHNISLRGWTELYQFDTLTGAISNIGVLDSTGYNYGAEFSPDNTKLYTWRVFYPTPPVTAYSQICQYDLTLPTLHDIKASRTIVSGAVTTYDGRRELKLAPDGRIYISSFGRSYMDCITHPDSLGTACGYVTNALHLGTGVCRSGLPNTITAPSVTTSTAAPTYSRTCQSNQYNLILSVEGDTTGKTFIWQDGSTGATYTPTTSGTYTVYIRQDCNLEVKTFHVSIDSLPTFSLGNDTTITQGNVLILSTGPLPLGTYAHWSTGTIGDTIHVHDSGSYWVKVWTEMCHTFDTINVAVTPQLKSAHINTNNISLYPNPAQTQFQLTVNGCSGTLATIRLLHTSGQTMYTTTTPIHNHTIHTTINVEKLPPATYQLIISNELGNTFTKPITLTK